VATTLTFTSLLQDLRRYIERGFTAASDPTVYEQLPRLVNNAERAIAAELKVQGFIANVTFSMVAGTDVYDKPDGWREWISVNIGLPGASYSVTNRASDGVNKMLTVNRPHGLSVGSDVTVLGVPVSQYNGNQTLTAVTQLTLTYPSASSAVEDVSSEGTVNTLLNKRKFLFTRSYEFLRAYWPDSSLTDVPIYYSDYDYYHMLVAPCPDKSYPCELNYYELPQLLDDGHQTNWLTDIAPQLLLYRSLLECAPFLKNAEMQQTWQAMYAQQAQALTGQDMDKINDRTSKRSKP
jgi:hypothetical protein